MGGSEGWDAPLPQNSCGLMHSPACPVVELRLRKNLLQRDRIKNYNFDFQIKLRLIKMTRIITKGRVAETGSPQLPHERSPMLPARLVLSICAFCVVFSASRFAMASTRIALIANSGRNESLDTLALAEAFLAESKDIKLVERNDIQRVLAEHNLSMSGLVNAEAAVRVGKLLGADVLAVVETEPQSRRALGMLVFETTTGLRLFDTSLSDTDPEEAARQIAAGLHIATAKRSLGTDKKRSICLVSVRNVDLPAMAGGFCHGVGRLVERVLTSSPDLAVLERERFHLIKHEIALGHLGQGGSEMKLLSALTTADLEVRRGKGDEVLVTATLYDGKGNQIGQAMGKADYMDALALAESLSTPLTTALKAARPTGKVRRTSEAERFGREALLLHRHGQYAGAMGSLEAALSLDPKCEPVLDTAAQIFLFTAGDSLDRGRFFMLHRAIHTAPKKHAASLSWAERGMDAAEKLFQLQAENAKPPLTEYLTPIANADGSYRLREATQVLPFLENCFQCLLLVEEGHSKKWRSRVRKLQERYGNLCRVIDARAYKAVNDRDSFIQYTNWLSVLMRAVELYSPTAASWADQNAELLDAWLSMAERYDIYHNEFFTINVMLSGTANKVAQLGRVGRSGQWVVSSADLKRLIAVYKKMADSENPALSVLGSALLLTTDIKTRQPLKTETLAMFAEFFAKAKAAIESKDCSRQDRTICYYAVLDAVESLPSTEARRREFRRLLDFMLSRKELVYGVVLAATEPRHVSFDYYQPYLYGALGERVNTIAPTDQYSELAEIAGRVLRGIENGELDSLDGRIARTRFKLLEDSERFFLSCPELRPKRPAPWTDAKRILSVTDYPDLHALSRVLVRDGTAWTVGLGANDDYPSGFIRLIAVDLDSGRRRDIVTTSYARGPVPATFPPYSDNCHIDIVGKTVYISSFYSGILIVSLNDKVGRRWVWRDQNLPINKRLPSDQILSLVTQNGKLYLSAGAFSGQGSYLVAFDLADRSVRTISSSRGSAGRTPLDNLEQPPLIFLPMISDTERHRVLFVVSHPLSHGGLWQIDTQTDNVRRLTSPQGYVRWMSGVRNGRVLMAISNENCTRWEAIEYDLATDSEKPVYSNAAAPTEHGPAPAEDILVTPDWLAQPPYLHVGDSWWTGRPFGRIPLGKRQGKLFPLLEDRPELLRQLLGMNHEYNWRQIEPLDNNRILVSDRYGIWILQMPKGESNEKAAK